MSDEKDEGGFYKGLFFGVLLGAGLSVFLGTKEGKQFVKKAKGKINDLLESEVVDEGFEDDEAEIGLRKEPRRRFFKKYKL